MTTKNTEISKNLKCILMRQGTEIWLEDEFVQNVEKVLLNTGGSKFLKIENQIINTADIVGIFDAGAMEEVTRRKNGQWKDAKGNWHDKGTRVCSCGNEVPFGKQCGYCA